MYARPVSPFLFSQPSGEMFDMLEDLMLLEGGRLAYFGTTQRARSFFDSLAGACPAAVNPAGTVSGCGVLIVRPWILRCYTARFNTHVWRMTWCGKHARCMVPCARLLADTTRLLS